MKRHLPGVLAIIVVLLFSTAEALGQAPATESTPAATPIATPIATPVVAATSVPVPAAPRPTIGPLAPGYQPFRVDLGFGWATVPAQAARGGNMSVEPKFNFLDQLSAGFRADLMISAGGRVGSPGSGDVAIRQQFAAAGLLKVDYFATTRRVRPWVSLAFGRYAIQGQQTSTSDDGASVEYVGGSYYGVSPQLGLELAAFRISATYNHLFGARVVVVENVGGQRRTEEYSQSYGTVEIGFRLGGRRYRR